jgi:hypothetical protein
MSAYEYMDLAYSGFTATYAMVSLLLAVLSDFFRLHQY